MNNSSYFEVRNYQKYIFNDFVELHFLVLLVSLNVPDLVDIKNRQEMNAMFSQFCFYFKK